MLGVLLCNSSGLPNLGINVLARASQSIVVVGN
jgi:hypothetical protein